MTNHLCIPWNFLKKFPAAGLNVFFFSCCVLWCTCSRLFLQCEWFVATNFWVTWDMFSRFCCHVSNVSKAFPTSIWSPKVDRYFLYNETRSCSQLLSNLCLLPMYYAFFWIVAPPLFWNISRRNEIMCSLIYLISVCSNF